MKKLCTLFAMVLFAGTALFTNQSYGQSPLQLMRGYLYVLGSGGDTTLLDGDLSQYDPSFSNAVDGLDARKMTNPGENMGMLRDGYTLAVERRHTIQGNDTTFYKIWNLNASRNYQIQLLANGMSQPGLIAYLEDLYLGTRTPVSLEGTTYRDFGINSDPASYNAVRFRLIYTYSIGGTLPLTFTSMNAYQQSGAVKIDWNTASESNLSEYTIEKSADGQTFKALASIQAQNLPIDNYTYTDAAPVNGNNFYRIMSTAVDGGSKYSPIMKVYLGDGASGMKVFPNPVIGNTVNLQLIKQPAGSYNLRLINGFGQAVLNSRLQHPGGSGTQSLNLDRSMPRGIYYLEITAPDNTKTNLRIIY